MPPYYFLNLFLMNKKCLFSIFLILFILTINSQESLDEYIWYAKQNNPQLTDFSNQVQLNQLESERIYAQYKKPQLNVSGAYLFAPIISKDNNKTTFNPNAYVADNYYGYDLAASNGGTYQGLINLNIPLLNKGIYDAYNNQTEINQQISSNNGKLLEHDVEKLVTDQYILCLLNKNQILFSDSLLQLIQDQIYVVNKMVESGYMKQSDLSLLKIEYQNTLAIQAGFKASYQKSVLTLKSMCGINDTTINILKDINLDLLPDSSSKSNYSEKFRLDSINVMVGQQVFETKYKPQLSLYSNAGLNAVYLPTIPSRLGLSAGINFTWNIYDGNQKELMQKKSDLQLSTISAYKRNLLAQNEVKKYNVLKEYETYKNREKIALDQLKEYDQLLITYKQEILKGQLSIINYITTLKNMSTAKRDYFVLKTNKLLLINAYNYWNW